MTNTELIKELRNLTQAGMKDCKDALEEANFDLQKAIDIVKTKGLNIVSGRSGKLASEGRVMILSVKHKPIHVMVEVNCQTDFVAQSESFNDFLEHTACTLICDVEEGRKFDPSGDVIENQRKLVVASTKENIVVRRWWAEEALDPTVKIFDYIHSNDKIGVILTMKASSKEITDSKEFIELGNDLAMQVAAMAPLSVSPDTLDPSVIARQKSIFETQLKELNKPEAAWSKIIDGKFNKFYTEVCLLNQESVIVPKQTVVQVIKNVSDKIGSEIQVVNFIRCQVGEGMEQKQEDLAAEVSKLL